MKSFPEHLKQALTALEFANAGHLAALTTLLDRHETDPGRCNRDADIEREDASAVSGTSAR